MAIIVGDCLVAQPSFLFGSATTTNFTGTYVQGTLLTLIVAFLCGCSCSLRALSAPVSTPNFMFVGGVALIMVGIFGSFFNLPINLHKWEFVMENFGMLLGVSVATWMSDLIMILTLKLTGTVL